MTAAGTYDRQAGFYRKWASLAASQALGAGLPQMKERCSRSAIMWAAIADAIDAADAGRVASLTHNLTFLPARSSSPGS